MVNDEATKNLVLNDPYIRKHRAVAVVKPIQSSKVNQIKFGIFGISSLLLFDGSLSKVIVFQLSLSRIAIVVALSRS